MKALQGKINEIKGNIFDYENWGALAWYVLAGSAPPGINYWADQRYHFLNWINKNFGGISWKGQGHCLTYCDKGFALIVGNKYVEHESYRQAFEELKMLCKERDIKRLVLPPAPAWQETKQIFMDVFMGSDIDIKIVYDEEYLKGEIKDGELDKAIYNNRDRSLGALAKKYY